MSSETKHRIGLLLIFIPIAAIFIAAIIYGGWGAALVIAAIVCIVVGAFLAIGNL